jgi:formylglycine-generating enzyme required for sulfatase activity
VKGKSPYGLFDMGGNVCELVQDWSDRTYYAQSPARNLAGPAQGEFKVLRGGSWSDMGKYMLTYGRFKLPPHTRNSYAGFRCAQTVSSEGHLLRGPEPPEPGAKVQSR